MITKIERFLFDGKEFDSLPKVTKYIESEIGKVIDSTPLRLHPRDALAVFNAIVSNRKRLLELLTDYDTKEDE